MRYASRHPSELGGQHSPVVMSSCTGGTGTSWLPSPRRRTRSPRTAPRTRTGARRRGRPCWGAPRTSGGDGSLAGRSPSDGGRRRQRQLRRGALPADGPRQQHDRRERRQPALNERARTAPKVWPLFWHDGTALEGAHCATTCPVSGSGPPCVNTPQAAAMHQRVC